MKLTLQQHQGAFIFLTLIPTLIYLPLGALQLVGSLSLVEVFLITTALASVTAYYIFSNRLFRRRESFDMRLSFLFYANYLMYMIIVLISFNLIVIAGFLYSEQVPMGMNLLPEQATSLLLLGIYLLLISSLGMYYHSFIKKKIKQASK
ncbi:hypothetical protein [Portibacter marinus]|uniref:hypothetical protein n=1 Tax=Portibacter marinus TaxID=2898660 RepID=UPI001F30F66F|nr:hypothetical protein [Portibacter marinus]